MKNLFLISFLFLSSCLAECPISRNDEDLYIIMYVDRQISYYEFFIEIHETKEKPLLYEQELKYEFDKGVLSGYKDVMDKIQIFQNK